MHSRKIWICSFVSALSIQAEGGDAHHKMVHSTNCRGDFQELRAISVCLLLCFERGLYFRYLTLEILEFWLNNIF